MSVIDLQDAIMSISILYIIFILFMKFAYTQSITEMEDPTYLTKESTHRKEKGKQTQSLQLRIIDRSLRKNIEDNGMIENSAYLFEEDLKEMQPQKLRESGCIENEHLRRELDLAKQQNVQLKETIYNLQIKKEKPMQHKAEGGEKLFTKQQMKKLTSSLKHYRSKVKKQQQKYNELMQRLRRVEKKVKEDLQFMYGQEISYLKLEQQIEQQKISLQRMEMEKLKKQLHQFKKLQEENYRIIHQNMSLGRDKEEFKKEIHFLEESNKKSLFQLEKFKRLAVESEQQIKTLKRAKQVCDSQMEQQKKKHQQENNRHNKQKQTLMHAKEKVDKELLELRRKMEEEIKKLQRKMQQLRIDKDEEIDRINTELQSYKEDNANLNHFKNKASLHIQDMQRTLGIQYQQKKGGKEQNMENRLHVLEDISRDIIKMRYFSDSQILSKLPQHKRQFLVHELRLFLNQPSFHCSLIYRFDPLNLTNFHNYFDNKERLLVLVHLKNGSVIGGFTSFAFNKSYVQRPGKGFLISITNEKSYRIRQNPRMPVAPYDQYYFILGNAQIRIRSQQEKVFSNFGIANATFQTQGDLRTRFLNVRDMGDNQLELQTYEFYQLS